MQRVVTSASVIFVKGSIDQGTQDLLSKQQIKWSYLIVFSAFLISSVTRNWFGKMAKPYSLGILVRI